MYYLTDSIKYKIILGALFIMNFTQFGVSATVVNGLSFSCITRRQIEKMMRH